jgi:hypothetical protein
MLLNLGINFKIEGIRPNTIFGVSAEKAAVLYTVIFFSAKNLKKGFSLQSLTQIDLRPDSYRDYDLRF